MRSIGPTIKGGKMESSRNRRSAFTAAVQATDSYQLKQEVDGVAPTEVAAPAPNDRNESRSYSLPRSIHDYLTTEAIKQSVARGQRISTSKLLLELIQKGMKQ